MKYLDYLKKYNITPNFLCSQEYFDKSEVNEKREGNLLEIQFSNKKDLLVPPFSLTEKRLVEGNKQVWMDMEECTPPKRLDMEFLDLEYIYDPKNFQIMKGDKWAVFRKNSRKFPRLYVGLEYVKISDNSFYDPINYFLENWITENSGKNWYDINVFIKYVLEGKNRSILLQKDIILAMNIWDYNYLYTNFRYCMCLKLPFLSEYARLLFYTIDAPNNKKVNDGGILENPYLEKFKNKLNPISIRKRYGWRKKLKGETNE